MDRISTAMDQLRQGLEMMRNAQRESHEGWLSLLAKFETRLNVKGDDWTWKDFEDISAARSRLDAEGLSTAALKARATKLLKADEKSRSALIREIEHGKTPGLSDRIKALVAGGEDPNGASLLKDVPLAFARDRGMSSIFDLLLELGADPAKVGFDALHQAIRFGALEDVLRALPQDDPLLSKPDMDPPLSLAITRGDVGIVAALLDEVRARGQITEAVVETCLGMAVQEGRLDLVALFLERGVDPDVALEDLPYRFDADMLDLLIAHGADVHRLGDLGLYHEDPTTVLDPEGQPAIWGFVDRLIAAGWTVDDLDEFEAGQIRFVTKAFALPRQDRNSRSFPDGAEPAVGTANPQDVTAPYHIEMARTGLSTFMARKEWKLKLPYGAWTADRFGQSTTRLPDGRWVQIAGEHEDHYDPDFMIFNDVVVHDGKGGLQVLFYPTEVFEPTDFHSASLVEDAIWIVGNTGYQGTRRVGETPVYRLDLSDFSIRRTAIAGLGPGWISRHTAQVVDGLVRIHGGSVFGPTGFRDNAEVFWLDPASLRWVDRG